MPADAAVTARRNRDPLDDQSTDDTAAIAKRPVEADPRAAVLQDNSTSIPPGWLGKSWACERFAQAATGDVLAFVDADVTLNPERSGFGSSTDART